MDSRPKRNVMETAIATETHIGAPMAATAKSEMTPKLVIVSFMAIVWGNSRGLVSAGPWESPRFSFFKGRSSFMSRAKLAKSTKTHCRCGCCEVPWDSFRS